MKHFKGVMSVILLITVISFVSCSGTTEPGDGNEGGKKTLTYIGTKVPTEAKAVGDIVFSDGSATASTAELTLTDAQKEKAIAVIYKVDGTKAYGVGLVHNKNGLAWCSSSANAYGNNIDTIQCAADDGGNAGNYTFNNATDKDGSKNLEQIEKWLSAEGSGTSDDTKGDGAADRYPAFYFAMNYMDQAGSHVTGTAYASGWYLPSLAELFDIYKEITTVDAALDKCNGSKFNNSVYWSSSQHASSNNNAYIFDFYEKVWNSNDKDINFYYVCCIRAFN